MFRRREKANKKTYPFYPGTIDSVGRNLPFHQAGFENSAYEWAHNQHKTPPRSTSDKIGQTHARVGFYFYFNPFLSFLFLVGVSTPNPRNWVLFFSHTRAHSLSPAGMKGRQHHLRLAMGYWDFCFFVYAPTEAARRKQGHSTVNESGVKD